MDPLLADTPATIIFPMLEIAYNTLVLVLGMAPVRPSYREMKRLTTICVQLPTHRLIERNRR
jgi:hypothetical protein